MDDVAADLQKIIRNPGNLQKKEPGTNSVPKPRSIPSADVTEEHTVYKRQGNPIKTMGGVELVVSAIIIPGGYESLDAKL